MHRQFLTAEEGVGSRPGLETAPAVVDLAGRPGEINQRVLALENWRQRCACIILRSRLDRARLQAGKSFEHKACTAGSQHWKQLLRRLIGLNRQRSLQQNIPGIETLIKAHGGGAGHLLTVRNRPLDRRRPAVFWAAATRGG